MLPHERLSEMVKKASGKIREEIARLQEQLKLAETREAERIGRVALKAGLGEVEIDEEDLLTAFTEVAAGFRKRPKTASKADAAGTSQGANGAA